MLEHWATICWEHCNFKFLCMICTYNEARNMEACRKLFLSVCFVALWVFDSSFQLCYMDTPAHVQLKWIQAFQGVVQTKLYECNLRVFASVKISDFTFILDHLHKMQRLTDSSPSLETLEWLEVCQEGLFMFSLCSCWCFASKNYDEL